MCNTNQPIEYCTLPLRLLIELGQLGFSPHSTLAVNSDTLGQDMIGVTQTAAKEKRYIASANPNPPKIARTATAMVPNLSGSVQLHGKERESAGIFNFHAFLMLWDPLL